MVAKSIVAFGSVANSPPVGWMKLAQIHEHAMNTDWNLVRLDDPHIDACTGCWRAGRYTGG